MREICPFLVRQIKRGRTTLRVLDVCAKVTGISDFSLECGIWESRCICPSVVYLPESVVNLSDHAFLTVGVNLTKWICSMEMLSVGNYAPQPFDCGLPFGFAGFGRYAFMRCHKLKNFSYSGHNYKLLGNLLQQWWQVYHLLVPWAMY